MLRKSLFLALSLTATVACQNNSSAVQENNASAEAKEVVEAFTLMGNTATTQSDSLSQGNTIAENGWIGYDIDVPQTGRYKLEAYANGADSAALWVEDYVNNPDERTYNITGDLQLSGATNGKVSVDGSPLQAGVHAIKVHAKKGAIQLDSIVFTLLQEQVETPKTLTQNMEGNNWELVWSDEFDGTGLPDSTKWSYNVGDWGWGNNEPQYYTDAKTKNARQEDGALLIEAHKNDNGADWSSARLTTQGRQTFLYGKIEFRAKVPAGRGTWAAGWLLGDDYRDEISWPYCGEIDVLETVGYEINDTTGNGLNHASCHTRAYYFKQGNHLTATIPMENMNNEWHTYGIEWYPDSIRAYVDDEFYYTYDKTANELEWPFAKPQNIILNLAVGGGWGGAKGIDPKYNKHQFFVDYVRVYQKN